MLEDLTIKNFALIESDYLEFSKGFTVFSGETGAGKSILIGALSFLLGGKSDVHQIRNGQSEASVCATFYIKGLCDDCKKISKDEAAKSLFSSEDYEPQSASEWLSFHGIVLEDDRVILRRFIRENGKTGAWISDTPVTRNDLVKFSSFLVDIHGQHEHQSLMKVLEHRKFLDERAGITSEVFEFTKIYAELVSKRRELSKITMNEKERLEKIERLQFALNEISQAKLKKNEDLELENEEKRLSSFERIYSSIENINSMLNENENSVVPVMKKIMKESLIACESDKNLKEINSRLESSFYELSDIADEFLEYQSALVFDPKRLSEVQNRLSEIYNLKKKYASSVNAPLSEVFDFMEKAQNFLEMNANGKNPEQVLAKEVSALEKTVLQKANEISLKRKSVAKILEKEVQEVLQKLGMNGSVFGVKIQEKEGTESIQKCGPYGIDEVEFMISANPGNPLQPLAKIASGGELSRVMLALKTIFASSDSVETLIFDEIDTGIGGEVAVAVGEHIKKLSGEKQIFCITHLASIAVYADNQIKIEKSVNGGITGSNVFIVEGENRVIEIARMLSGDSKSEQSLEHARNMLKKFSGSY